MAPEVLSGETATTKSDVWSLGITCIEMVQSLPPHHKYPIAAAIYRICTEGPPTFQNPGSFSMTFTAFVQTLLQKDVNLRPNVIELLTVGLSNDVCSIVFVFFHSWGVLLLCCCCCVCQFFFFFVGVCFSLFVVVVVIFSSSSSSSSSSSIVPLCLLFCICMLCLFDLTNKRYVSPSSLVQHPFILNAQPSEEVLYPLIAAGMTARGEDPPPKPKAKPSVKSKTPAAVKTPKPTTKKEKITRRKSLSRIQAVTKYVF
jgi:serine/threonine protein kinase